MKDVAVRDTRNFALVGHAGDGKTTLGEALLHTAGAISEMGRVEDGSSHLNFLPEEKDGHTATITSHVFSFDWSGKHLTLVDTPGDPNFQADGEIALRALDGAILVVSAVDGAKVGTEKMYRAAGAAGLPVMAWISAIDHERARFDAALDSLSKIGAKPVPVTLPLAAGSSSVGVADLLHGRAYTAGGEGEIPAEHADAVAAAREQLVESVAECDDELLEKYLDEGELSEDEVLKGLCAGARARQLVPVLCGAAPSGLGIPVLLREIAELLPSPEDRAPWPARGLDGDGELEVAADPAGPFSAVVFKTIIDRYAGLLSVFRVVSGTVKGDSAVLNASKQEKVRLGKIFVMRGEEHVEVPEAGPGDVVAAAKLKDVHTGNVLTGEKGGLALVTAPLPQGVLSYAISAKSQGDEDKVHASLGRLVEEDPTLQLGREASTGEFLLTGMGELHIRTTVQKLRRMFDVEVELKTPKVPYRETIVGRAENVEGKLKKQTGGKGMFGVCYLTVEPLPRGKGIEFVDEIVGGAIPRGLIPAVEKGVLESCEHGPLAGYPVVDVRVRCIDGKHHSVDSNEMAFKLAASFGFKAAMEKARPTLLEPVMTVEVAVPDEHVGDAMGDISGRRGRVQSTEASGASTVILAEVPMAEMLEYASALTSMTGGKGSFHMEFAHYDEVPANIRDKIVSEAQAGRQGD